MNTTEITSSLSWRWRLIAWLSQRLLGVSLEACCEAVHLQSHVDAVVRAHDALENAQNALQEAKSRTATLEADLDLERSRRQAEARKHEAEVEACRAEVKLLADVVERDRLRVQAESASYAMQVAMSDQRREGR